MQYRFGGKAKDAGVWRLSRRFACKCPGEASEAKKLLAAGADPSVAARLEKLTKATARYHTFDLIADEYLAKLSREGRTAATVEKTGWLLDFARPLWRPPDR